MKILSDFFRRLYGCNTGKKSSFLYSYSEEVALMAHVDHEHKDEGKNKQLAVWDITCWPKEKTDDPEPIRVLLREIAKKWVFQQEQAQVDRVEAAAAATTPCATEEEKTPARHWQIRLSLVRKLRKSGIIKLLKGTPLEGANCKPTTRGQRDGFDYVMKTATRVAGPWRDGAEEEKREEPAQIKGKTLLKWQEQCRDHIMRPMSDLERRKVNVLYDPVGGVGKSIFKAMCNWKGWAAVPPYFTDMKDTMAFALARPSNAYLIDVPRDAFGRKIKDFWAGVESLKDGIAYETRYRYQEAHRDNPKMWILTNTMPNKAWMSPDRWVFWMVGPDGGLLDVTDAGDAYIEKLSNWWSRQRAKETERAPKRAKLPDIPQD